MAPFSTRREGIDDDDDDDVTPIETTYTGTTPKVVTPDGESKAFENDTRRGIAGRHACTFPVHHRSDYATRQALNDHEHPGFTIVPSLGE